MHEIELSRRALLRNTMYLGGGALVLAACTSGGSDDVPAEGSSLPDIEGGEVVTDPSQFPTELAESPEFAQQVADGSLPPVAERIGQDPLVIRPVHEVGSYGGTIRRGFVGIEDSQNANLFCAGPDNLLYWDYRHENVVPNIARGFEWNDDFTELTLQLRRGMHWSDGMSFTADDITFWRDDINLNPDVSSGSTALRINNRDVVVEKVDDFTVVYRCPEPYTLLPEFLAGLTDVGGQSYGGDGGGGGFAPKHYLKQFLPKYTTESEANTAAKDAGFESWIDFLLYQNSWYQNPELPTLTPWVCTRPLNDPPWEFAANPYSVWVDVEGNQLPYIPTITMSDTQETQVVALRAISGDYDFQDRGLEVKSLPTLVKGEDGADYTVHQAPGESIDCAVLVNLAYDKDPEIGALLRTVEFRRALSLAVDRHQINETFFLGTSTPTATVPSDASPYFPGKEWRTNWATHDVDQANQLLDQIGLTDKDDDGFRMHPNGQDRIRLEIMSAASRVNFPAVGDTIRRQWHEIGIDTTNQSVEGTLYVDRIAVNDVMLSVNTIVGTEDPFIAPHGVLPTVEGSSSQLIGPPYVQWFTTGGSEGTRPPESLRLLEEGARLYQEGLRASESERIELGQQIYELHADQVWSIGIVGLGLSNYGLYYAKNSLGNIPGRIHNSGQLKYVTATLPMTFYYR